MEIYKKIPLGRILKGKFLKIARTQDIVIIELLRRFDFVLHGGTAVWRVYGGKRFSYDIDIYHKNPSEIAEWISSAKFLTLLRKKLTPSGILYIKLKDEDVVELEVSPFFKKIKTVDAEFNLTDGSTLVIKTLSPEDLLKEKINAFINRKKGRDLYDVYYLIDFCDKEKIKSALKKLVKHLEKPKDFEGLRELILIGKEPSFEMILKKVKRYAQS